MRVHGFNARRLAIAGGACALSTALVLVACSATEFDPDFMLDGEPGVLQVRACPPDQATSNSSQKVVAATYSGKSITIEVVDGTVLQTDLSWGKRLCQNGADGDRGNRTNEASFLVRPDAPEISAVVRVQSWRDANCGEPLGADDTNADASDSGAIAGKRSPIKTALVDLSSITATTCVTIEGTPPDGGPDASEDADAGESDADGGEDADADAMIVDSGMGDADAH